MTRAIVSKERVGHRLAEMVESGQGRARQVIERLAADAVEDRVITVGRNGQSTPIEVAIDGDSRVGLLYQGQSEPHHFHPNALRQFAEKVNLLGRGGNLKEWIEGQPWQRQALADVMATTLQHTSTRERLLMRSVDRQIRGVLSDQYRRLDSSEIIHAFLTASNTVGMVPYRAHYDEIKWSMEMVLPHMLELATPDGIDYIGIITKLRSSDFGASSQELAFGVLRLACINGLVGEKMLREVHLGMRLPDDIQIADTTYKADTMRSAGLIADSVRSVMSQQALQRRLAPLQQAATVEIDAPKKLEGLVKAKRITKAESEKVQEILVRANPEEAPTGTATAWRLANAITLLGNHAEVSEDRAHDLQRLSGWLCGLSKEPGSAS